MYEYFPLVVKIINSRAEKFLAINIKFIQCKVKKAYKTWLESSTEVLNTIFVMVILQKYVECMFLNIGFHAIKRVFSSSAWITDHKLFKLGFTGWYNHKKSLIKFLDFWGFCLKRRTSRCINSRFFWLKFCHYL